MGQGALLELAKLVIPGGAAIVGIWKTVQFVTAEVERLLALAAAVGDGLVAAVQHIDKIVADAVVVGLQKLLELLLGLISGCR